MGSEVVLKTGASALAKGSGFFSKIFSVLLINYKISFTMIFLLIIIARGGYMAVEEKNPMILVNEVVPRVITSQNQLDKEIDLLRNDPEALIITEIPIGTPAEKMVGWWKIIWDRILLYLGIISSLWFTYIFYLLIFKFYNTFLDVSDVANHVSAIVTFVLLQLFFVNLLFSISLIKGEETYVNIEELKDKSDIELMWEITKQTHAFNGLVSFVVYFPDIIEPIYQVSTGVGVT